MGKTQWGAFMIDVRSRRAAAAVATSAAVLLSVPVVAAGQVPGVDQVVGGVQQTAESLVPAPAAPVRHTARVGGYRVELEG